ncbi:MAG: hypothetical protein QM784_13395 [Polyangiaceae bacterium]
MKEHRNAWALGVLVASLGGTHVAWAQAAAQPSSGASGTVGTGGSLELGTSTGSGANTTTAGANGTAAGETSTTANVETQPASEPVAVAAVTPPPAPPVANTAPTEPTAAAAAEHQTDHERVAGHYGVGLLGVVNMSDLQSDGGSVSTSVPVIGARRWVNDAWGIQAGLGLAHHSGTASTDVPNTRNVEDPTRWAFAAHVGVPFALYHDSHYAFLFLPEANFGYSTWREKDDRNFQGDQGQDGHSFLVDVAARAGAEIHFGFMGLPMLTLQGTVGAHVTYRDSRAKSVNAAGQSVEQGRYTLDVMTANYHDPWDIFTSSIAALYYFK